MAIFIELFLLGVGLSMDAFAVSVCKGLGMRKLNKKQAVIIGLYFGGFQALMPLIGWLLGSQFQKYITSIDHWIAFILLLYLGGKMIYDSTQEEDEDCKTNPLCNKTLFGLSIATSIDALAIGISLAILKSDIIIQASLIGIVTFLMSVSGVYFGSRFGRKVDLKLDLIGGLILIGIGTKILIEHLYFNG